MSDWVPDAETSLLWDQYGIDLDRTAPKDWNLYPWEKNLNVMNRAIPLIKFDNKFDLPERNLILNDITRLTGKLQITDTEKHSLKQIVAIYRKNSKQPYERNNGWIELIIPFILIKKAPGVVYNLFESIQNRYILQNDDYIDKALYLLLFYHDPQLAFCFKDKQVSFDSFCRKWIKTLFAGVCSHQTTIKIWEYYFNPEGRERDPLFILFLIIAIVIGNRNEILKHQNSDDEVVLRPFLSSIPSNIKPEDVDSICFSAEKFKLNTPKSAQEEFNTIFLSNKNVITEISEFPCLYILPSEIIVETDGDYANQPLQPIKYHVIDCRLSYQFEAGHLPIATNLDYSLHYRDPSLFANQIDNLVNTKKANESEDLYAPDIHFCFMDNGDKEEMKYLIRIVISIMKTHVKHISILKYGYEGIHDCFNDQISCQLDHNPERCLICNPKAVQENRETIGKKRKMLKRIGSIIKCVNPTPDDSEDGYSIGTIKCAEKEFNFKIVDIEAYKKKLNIIKTDKCLQINILNQEEYESLLIFTDYDIILLRIVKNHSHAAYVSAVNHFSTLLQILSFREDLNLLTLRFSEKTDGQTKITKKYRVRVINGSDTVEFIERQFFTDTRRSLDSLSDQE